MIYIEDPYVAFCFNQAIGYWGITIENEMNQVEGKNSKEINAKRELILQRWLADDDKEQPRGQFADPALFFK